ncbi:MAG: hypothetical protein K2J25_05000 [Oscillospiraceae bacterium]|nr:hypothetical protein [Oscillospiraceae bacterium]
MKDKASNADKLMELILNKYEGRSRDEIARKFGWSRTKVSNDTKEARNQVKYVELGIESMKKDETIAEKDEIIAQQQILIQQLMAQLSVEPASNCGLFQFQSTDSNGLFVLQNEAQRNNAMNTFSNLC